MSEQTPHSGALENFERACILEAKLHYALQHPDKGRVFAALGFSGGTQSWEALREAIRQRLPHYPATYLKQNEYGRYYEVVLPVRSPTDKEAPVKTVWIYRREENFPRLVTLYIIVKEWTRWEQEKGNATEGES